ETCHVVAHILANGVGRKYPRHVSETDAVKVAVGLSGPVYVTGRIHGQRDGMMETQLRAKQARLIEGGAQEQEFDVLTSSWLELHRLTGDAAKLLIAQPALIQSQRAHDGRRVIRLSRPITLHDQQFAAELLEAIAECSQ